MFDNLRWQNQIYNSEKKQWFGSSKKTIAVDKQSKLDEEQRKICNDNLGHGVRCVTH